MPRKHKTQVSAKNIQGLKYFKMLQPLFAPLHDRATQRDQAGNRQLFFETSRSRRQHLGCVFGIRDFFSSSWFEP